MKKLTGIAASFACFLALGAQVQAGELFDDGRFMASMEDSYKGHNYRNTHNSESFQAALEDGFKGYNYRNVHNYDSFVASLGDSREGYSRNTHNAESFIAALEDGFKGYNYRNVHNYESFIASLGDSHEGYYRNIHNETSFVAALEDGYSAGKYQAIMANAASDKLIIEKHEEEALSAAYSPRPCKAEDMDLLSGSIVLAKLSAQCE